MCGYVHFRNRSFATRESEQQARSCQLCRRSGAPWRDLPECYGIAGLRLLQRLERVADIGVKPAAAGIQMRKNRLAHPRIPEFLDVVGDAGHRLVVALALKEFSN